MPFNHPGFRTPASFSIEEFTDLVSTAFNISNNTHTPLSLPVSPEPIRYATSSCFESDTDDEEGPSTRGHPTSPSRPRTAMSMFKEVRTRASALVVRSTKSNTARACDPLQTPRPSLSSQCTVIPAPPLGTLALPRRSENHTAAFLQMHHNNCSTATMVGRTVGNLPSFFEDRAYRFPPSNPSYRRPSMPSEPPTRIHARLPPLRKAQSFTTGLFSKAARKRTKAPWTAADCASVHGDMNSRCPSPFTCPRDPPPPPLPRDAAALWQDRDDADELQVPDYVFARRGSATSTETTTSTRSTSSLASRIAQILPLASKIRSRSKLNLTVSTVNSSPCGSNSTGSTSTWSPVTPTGNYTFPGRVPSIAPAPYTFPEKSHEQDEYSRVSNGGTRLRTNTIGRVLTLEQDPFAKADIALRPPVRRFDNMPRPPTPPRFSLPARRSDVPVSPQGVYAHPDIMKARGSMPRLPSESPAYTFPSTCSVYAAPRRSAAVDSPTPAHVPMESNWLSSRFSSPSCSSASDSGSDCDNESIIASPPPSPQAHRTPVSALEDSLSRHSSRLPKVKPTEVETPGPPVPPKDRMLLKRTTICASPSRNVFELGTPPPRRSRTRASLPPSPRSPRVLRERAPSPFPLVRGVSDGSEKARIRAAGEHVRIPRDDFEEASMPEDTKRVEAENSDPFDAALEDSCVLGSGFVENLHRLSVAVEVGVWNDVEGTPTAESAINFPSNILQPSVETVRTAPPLSASTIQYEVQSPASLLTPSPVAVEGEPEWDRHTACSSTFYSARSSISSTPSTGSF
ncbi:hypothetical protein B0H21DRAFT_426843 [Amylocystis lapponica]|nr:hypothetical protein B0H21DRAFT_426843 [Amylocystis lapponica]